MRIIPIRQEQLKQRLGDRFRELDVPLLVEWADGCREALLFVLEEESDARRFSVYRLVHYCLDLAELLKTHRLVPVVIFLQAGPCYAVAVQLAMTNLAVYPLMIHPVSEIEPLGRRVCQLKVMRGQNRLVRNLCVRICTQPKG